PSRTRGNRQLGREDRLETLDGGETPRNRAQNNERHPRSIGIGSHAELQGSGIQGRSRIDAASIDGVLIVADEDEWRPYVPPVASSLDGHRDAAVLPPDSKRRDGERPPLAASLPLLLFAFPDEAWIHTEARVVQEDV